LVQNKTEKSTDGRDLDLPKEKWIIHQNHHEAIIKRELFEAVQIQRAERRKKLKKSDVPQSNNIFKGKTFCSRCGHAASYDLHSHLGRRKSYRTYWCRYCLPELKRENNIVGKSMALPLDDLEAMVREEITCRIEACVEIESMLRKVKNAASITEKRNALITERNRLRKALEKATDLLTAAYAHLLSGLLNENEFNAAREKFEGDKKYTQAQLARVEEQIARYDTNNAWESECLTSFRRFKGFERLTKEIVGVLVKRIEITPLTNEVLITLNFKDSFNHLNSLLEESGVGKDVG
jgi:ribosomal protein S14